MTTTDGKANRGNHSDQGQPQIGEDYSSEAERRQAKPPEKRSKTERVRIDWEEIIADPSEYLPVDDAGFQGYARSWSKI